MAKRSDRTTPKSKETKEESKGEHLEAVSQIESR
jgi:hypothetical protein